MPDGGDDDDLKPPPSPFVVGMIIPFAGKVGDLDLKEWAPCDGTDQRAPNLNGLFLVGTNVWANVNKSNGSPAGHHHTYTVTTPNMMLPGNGDAKGYNIDVGGNPPAVCGMDHYHHFSGTTDDTTWVPPAQQVMFIMKV